MQLQASPVPNPPSPCAASSSSPTPLSTSFSSPKYPRLTRSSLLQRHPAIKTPLQRVLERCEETPLSLVLRRCIRRSGRCCPRRGSVFSSPCRFSFTRVSRRLGELLGRAWISWRIGWFLPMGLWRWCFGFGWVELGPFLGREVLNCWRCWVDLPYPPWRATGIVVSICGTWWIDLILIARTCMYD